VGTGEHKRQAPVGDFLGRCRRLFDLVGHELQMLLAGRAGLPPADGVCLSAPRYGEQPGVRVVGYAVARPGTERRREGVGERIFGARNVACTRREEGD
jgi:hypothetical protein